MKLLFVLAALVASCQNHSGKERYVITETAPFYDYHSRTYSEGDNEKTIAEVRRFAVEKGMDFLLSHDGPQLGDFNASANGPDLNLHALHVKAVEGGLDIFAIARGNPAPKDRRVAEEFACRVAHHCPPASTASLTRTRSNYGANYGDANYGDTLR